MWGWMVLPPAMSPALTYPPPHSRIYSLALLLTCFPSFASNFAHFYFHFTSLRLPDPSCSLYLTYISHARLAVQINSCSPPRLLGTVAQQLFSRHTLVFSNVPGRDAHNARTSRLPASYFLPAHHAQRTTQRPDLPCLQCSVSEWRHALHVSQVPGPAQPIAIGGKRVLGIYSVRCIHVHMCMYAHIRMYVCTYVCICVQVYARVYMQPWPDGPP